MSSFKATGIAPLNPKYILNRFTNATLEDLELREYFTLVLSGEDWRKIEKLMRSVVKD